MYESFNEGVNQRLIGSYEGAMGMMATGPDTVAKVIERAASSSRPRARYVVTAGAKLLHGTRVAMPDAVWDTVMRTQFPSPAASPDAAPSHR